VRSGPRRHRPVLRRVRLLADESANTIVVVGKAEPRRYAACIVLATYRLDVNRSVRDRLGTRKASFASADETREISGMEIGGVTPFGLPDGLPVWIDAAVMDRPRVILGGGSRSWKVISTPAILAVLAGAAVVEGLRTRPSPGPNSVGAGAATEGERCRRACSSRSWLRRPERGLASISRATSSPG